MLEVVGSKASAATRSRGGFDVEILSVATANPPHSTQPDRGDRAAPRRLYPHLKSLWPLYTNTGIDYRYSVEPMEWHLQPRTWEQRTRLFQEKRSTCWSRWRSRPPSRPPPLKTSTSSSPTRSPGSRSRAWTPLMNRLGSAHVERTPLFGLGCGAGVGGLAAPPARQARPGANVMFLTVELCTLCMRTDDPSPAFRRRRALRRWRGRCRPAHTGGAARGPRRRAIGRTFLARHAHIMGWDIKTTASASC